MNKPKFNPNLPFEIVDEKPLKPKFDPNKPFEVVEGNRDITTTKPEAFIQGLGQGVSLGYLPQIQAATEPYIQKALDFFGGDDSEKKLIEQGFKIRNLPEKSYVERRDEAIRQSEKMSKEQPVASIAGQIAGTIPSAIGATGLFKAGVTSLGKIGQAAKVGALIGAARNPSDKEGEVNPFQVKERAINALKDAATGAVLQGGIEGVGKIGKMLKNSPDTIGKWSQLKSLKASGAMLKDFRKQFGNKRAYELGQAIIDNGLVSVGDDIAEVAAKAEGLKNISGQKIGQIYSQADDAAETIMNSESAAKKIALQDSAIDLDKFSKNFLYKVQEKYTGKAGGETVVNKLASELEQIGLNGEASLSKIKELRSSIDDLINYSKSNLELKPVQSELLNLRNELQNKVRSRLAAIDKINGTKLAKDFAIENKNFSNIAEVARMAQDKAARESSNAAFGLRERISGGIGTGLGASIGSSIGGPAGAAIGGVVGGGLGAISTKVARKYGTPFVAITANKIAKALSKNQRALDVFSDPLIKASQKSPKEFVNAVNILISKPEFKKKVRELKVEE